MRVLTLVFALATVATLPGQVAFVQSADSVKVNVNGKPFTELFYGKDAPKPYLHPLLTASGKQVTRGYPMAARDGDPKDHLHHRGLWFTHGDVNGYDFWMNEFSYKGEKRGLIKLVKVDQAKGGSKYGDLQATYLWSDPAGQPLLEERTNMRFYAAPDTRTIDFTITMTPKVDVTFGDTKEGTFAIRLTPELDEQHTGKMTNAEGQSGEKQVWGKASPWVDYAGKLEGEAVGIAILDHPTNAKFPTYWHSRAYGLFAANRYGDHDFLNDKSKNGAVKYEAGKPVTIRYRVIIHPGDAQTADIAKAFAAWSKSK